MFKPLPPPEKLAKYRVMVVIYRPKEEMYGMKRGEFLMQRKDTATYYEAFAGKLTFFGTQVYQKDETIEEALERTETELRKGETDEEALVRSGTQLRKKETPREALVRRLRKEVPSVADRIISKMFHWNGLNLSRQQIPGIYYGDVFVAIIRDFKEMEDLKHGMLIKGIKQGIPMNPTREEAERMVSTSIDDLMMDCGKVIEHFLKALDAGEFDEY